MKKIIAFIAFLIVIPILLVYGQGGGNSLNIVNTNVLTDGDFVFCGSPNYNFTDKITVAAWVKWTTTPGYLTNNHESEGQWATVIAMDGHVKRDDGQFWLHHNSSDSKFEWAVKTVGGRNYVFSTTTPQKDKWYYLVGVYDNNSEPKIKFYVNGVLEASTSSGVSGNINSYNSSFKLNMGRLPSGYRYFSGNIDEVRIWSSALSQAEIIRQMYSKSTISSTEANLLSYWSMDNISGSSVPDSKGVANGIFYTLLVDAHDCAPPTVPGGSGFSFGSNWIKDIDKSWTTNMYAGLNFYTVAGNGFGNSYTISSNTSNTITVNSNFAITPVVDNFGSYQNGPSGMSWFGIEGSNETYQSVTSAAPVASSSLDNLTDICGIWDTKLSNTSSILSVSNTNIDANNSDECLLWGHNNADFNTTSSGNPGGVSSRLNRTWKFQVHKSGGVTAKISIDCSGLPITDGSLLRLLISNSENFSSASVLTGTYASNTFSVTISTLNGPFNSIGDNSYITLGSTGVLPVNLLSFNYSIENKNNVKLYWRTNFEINNKGFDVERKDMIENSWHKIGFVSGKPNGNINDYEYKDNNLMIGEYNYRLKQIDYNGNFEYFDLNGNVIINFPLKFNLSQNYPNPFNPITKIKYEIASNSFVKLSVYDLSGKEIESLVNKNLVAGIYEATWNAAKYSSGVYFVMIEAGDYKHMIKMLLIK